MPRFAWSARVASILEQVGRYQQSVLEPRNCFQSHGDLPLSIGDYFLRLLFCLSAVAHTLLLQMNDQGWKSSAAAARKRWSLPWSTLTTSCQSATAA